MHTPNHPAQGAGEANYLAGAGALCRHKTIKGGLRGHGNMPATYVVRLEKSSSKLAVRCDSPSFSQPVFIQREAWHDGEGWGPPNNACGDLGCKIRKGQFLKTSYVFWQ